VRTAALREELRERDVLLEADGLTLHVDAPAGALTDKLRTALRENKHALIRHVECERGRLEEAASRGLVIMWAREPGYVSLHDPTTGEWHEVRASECPPSVVESAKAIANGAGRGNVSEARVSSVTRRILDNENDLVRLLANERDTDLRAIRKEGNCG
jgi:hypothetical protein